MAGVWTIYFTDQPIRRFRDFARFAMDKNHPVQRAYRDWLLEHGIYVHPHYMIRGFLTGAHTTDDVDRLVDATASFLREQPGDLAAPPATGPAEPPAAPYRPRERGRSEAQRAQVLAVRALAGDHRGGRVRRAERLVLLDHEPAR